MLASQTMMPFPVTGETGDSMSGMGWKVPGRTTPVLACGVPKRPRMSSVMSVPDGDVMRTSLPSSQMAATRITRGSMAWKSASMPPCSSISGTHWVSAATRPPFAQVALTASVCVSDT